MSEHQVLLVDDEPAVLESLKRSLRKQPYDVLTATSPEEALDILGAEDIDVVVSDQRMPGLTGSSFLSIVANRHSDVMRIMLTGEATLEVALAAINEGHVYRFLQKPCSPGELANAVDQALELKRLRRESARLLRLARRQQEVLTEIEGSHPGITSLELDDDGGVVIEDDGTSFEDVMRQMELELSGRVTSSD